MLIIHSQLQGPGVVLAVHNKCLVWLLLAQVNGCCKYCCRLLRISVMYAQRTQALPHYFIVKEAVSFLLLLQCLAVHVHKLVASAVYLYCQFESW
jgi:hypothetical protein